MKQRETVPAPKSAKEPDSDAYRRAVEDAAKAPLPQEKRMPAPETKE